MHDVSPLFFSPIRFDLMSKSMTLLRLLSAVRHSHQSWDGFGWVESLLYFCSKRESRVSDGKVSRGDDPPYFRQSFQASNRRIARLCCVIQITKNILSVVRPEWDLPIRPALGSAALFLCEQGKYQFGHVRRTFQMCRFVKAVGSRFSFAFDISKMGKMYL
jgi:hypothetical protein